jgi:hypothetical protein
MAGPLRVESTGAYYHVINRGSFCFPIFREERDREMILEKPVDVAERFNVRVRAYCLQIVSLLGRRRGWPAASPRQRSA